MKDRDISMLVLGMVGIGVMAYLFQDDCSRERLQLDSPKTSANRPQAIQSRYLSVQDNINKKGCVSQADIDNFNSITKDVTRTGLTRNPQIKTLMGDLDKSIVQFPRCAKPKKR